MSKIIHQSVVLPAPADKLYIMYVDPKLHREITGGAVTISEAPGSEFSAFDGSITGKTLQVIPGRLIVQSWRSDNFRPEDIDSTLILTFLPDKKGGRVDLVHVNVSEVDFEGVTEGWKLYYWDPWRKYFKG